MALSNIQKTSHQNASFQWINLNSRQVTMIGCGALLVLGGFFLLLASQQILPQTQNIISRLKLANTIMGATSCVIGLSTIYLGSKKESSKVDLANKPRAVGNHILQFLNPSELVSVSGVSKRWNAISENDVLWQKHAQNLLTKPVRDILYGSRKSWKVVVCDLLKPFTPKSDRLSPGPIVRRGEPRNYHTLEIGALKEALEELKADDQISSINLMDNDMMTPLFRAAKDGCLEQAKLLIEYGAKDAFAFHGNVYGASALFYAAVNGHVEMVRLLLENGAQPGVNFNPVYHGEGVIGSFPHFLMRHFLVNFDNIDHNKALECAFLLIKGLKHQPGVHSLHAREGLATALSLGLYQVVDVFLACGLTEIDLEPYVYVERAISNNNLSMVQVMVERKFFDFINFRFRGFSILYYCLVRNANEILDYLIKIGVPTHLLNNEGETYRQSGLPVLGAKVRRAILHRLNDDSFFDPETGVKAETIEELLRNPIDLNIPIDAEGNTVLHKYTGNFFWMSEMDIGIIDHLLKAGANPNLQNKIGETPIAVAKKCISEAQNSQPESFNEHAKKRLEKMLQKS